MPPYPPIVMQVQVQENHCGEALAVFAQQPNQAHYELLQAVGVTFLGGEARGTHYLARFRNHLPTHIHAGFLSHFSRTSHCNLFFLQHGTIDASLATGLQQAANHRVAWAGDTGRGAALQLAQQACAHPLPMLCEPPPPAQPFAFGDLVPLGLLLRALRTTAPAGGGRAVARTREAHFLTALGLAPAAPTPAADWQPLADLLQRQRQGQLWAFHSARLPTSTDSALVLLGVQEPEALEALEVFSDARGGYVPQLWAREQAPGKMLLTPAVRHWCQSDYATTCLVRGLYHEHGRTSPTPLAYLSTGFASRSGLYFANPYLVDWVLALALRGDAATTGLQHTLQQEILASINTDYSFGQYDQALSTALAILSLAALGYRGRTLRLAQLRLLAWMDDTGTWPVSIPFYSTERLRHEDLTPAVLTRLILWRPQQIIHVHEHYYGISWYHDCHKIFTTAAAVLALAVPCDATAQETDWRGSAAAHPRYGASSATAYVRAWALPPYVASLSTLPDVNT
jgi:hypothetical protein